MSKNNLPLQVECLIFCSPKPLGLKEITEYLQKLSNDDTIDSTQVQHAMEQIIQKYQEDTYSFHIIECGGGYQFLTKPTFEKILDILTKNSKKKLSNATMEVLSIIAYKQPLTKSEIEQIRGVNSDYSIQKLLKKDLIYISGKSPNVGNALLYSTTQKFLDYLGVNTLEELPLPKDFSEIKNLVKNEAEKE